MKTGAHQTFRAIMPKVKPRAPSAEEALPAPHRPGPLNRNKAASRQPVRHRRDTSRPPTPEGTCDPISTLRRYSAYTRPRDERPPDGVYNPNHPVRRRRAPNAQTSLGTQPLATTRTHIDTRPPPQLLRRGSSVFKCKKRKI